jgi:hypothetical protein
MIFSSLSERIPDRFLLRPFEAVQPLQLIRDLCRDRRDKKRREISGQVTTWKTEKNVGVQN